MLWPSLPTGGTSSRNRDVVTGVLIGSVATYFIFRFWPFESSNDNAQKKKKSLNQPQRIRTNTKSATRSARSRDITEQQSNDDSNDDVISTSFFTKIMEQLWDYIKIAGADMIRETVEPSFADLPGPMKTCRFTKIDLGNVPMKMDNIVVHNIENGKVQFDMDMVWDGECDIQLKADYIGTFGVQHLKLSGRMAIVLKPLTNELPIVSSIQYAFINPPQIQLTFSGLASVAELSVLETSVHDALQSSMSIMVLPNRKLYKMNATTHNFLDTYQPPVGIARIKLETGRGFVIEKRLLAADDVPDVYLNVSLGNGSVQRTRTIQDDLNPTWNEVLDFCLHDNSQVLQIHAWDEDTAPLDPDDDLGMATVVIGNMLLQPQRRIELPLHMQNKKTKQMEATGAHVTVSCEICQWTSDLSSILLRQDQPSLTTSHDEICGLLVVIVNRAFDLPLSRTEASTFVRVTTLYNGQPKENGNNNNTKTAATTATTFDSKLIYDYPGWDSVNPVYDSAFTIPIKTSDLPWPSNDDNAIVQLDLIQQNTDPASKEAESILGSTTVTFGDLKTQPACTLTERRPMGDYGASLEFRVSLSGVAGTGKTNNASLVAPATSSPTRPLPPSPAKSKIHQNGHQNGTANGYHVNGGKRLDFDGSNGGDAVTSESTLGQVQVTIVNGRGLKIQEELFSFDVPDVYCKVDFDGQSWTTTTKHNSVTPVWNESQEFPLVDHGQIITIHAWDQNEREEFPDVEIGSAKTTVGKLLLAGGSMEMEMKKDGRPSGVYIQLRCDMVES